MSAPGRRVVEVRHEGEADSWRISHAPSPRPGIAYADYEERTTSFTARRELASTRCVVLFNLGEPIGLTGADGASIHLEAGEGFVAGIAAGTSISRSGGRQRGLQLHLPWQAVPALCGVPLTELADRVVRLDDLSPRLAELAARLADAPDRAARFALLDAALAPPDAPVVAPALVDAARRLRGQRPARTRDLAASLGWSQRHFIARFAQATGHRPGRYARLARFERFAAALRHAPSVPLAEQALAAGYSDQSHLNRDCAGFAAETPAALRARLIPGAGGFADA